MPRAAHRPQALRGRVISRRRAVAQGLLTRSQWESQVWRPLLRGVYADADLEHTHGLYIAAARLRMPKQAAIAGRSAAFVLGAHELAGVEDPVECVVPIAHRFGPVAGLAVRTVTELPAHAVQQWAGGWITSALHTCADLARFAPGLAEAVVLMDIALAKGVLREVRLERCRESVPVGRGSRQARRAMQLADARSESPQESRLRVGLVLAGLPPAVPQFEVRHQGRFLASVDLAYPEAKLAIEYDGLWHAAPGQLGRDRRRLNALVSAGWRVIHVTAADLHDLTGIVTAIRAALAA